MANNLDQIMPTTAGTVPLARVDNVASVITYNADNIPTDGVRVDYTIAGRVKASITFLKSDFNPERAKQAILDEAKDIAEMLAWSSTEATPNGDEVGLLASFNQG